MSSFTSKVGELVADYAHRMMNSIENFNLNLRSLQENLTSLSAKASDVEKEIKNAELSGRMKRKREVEEWLEEVKSIEKDVVEFGAKAVTEEFIRSLMDGGKITQLNERVVKLNEQGRHFGELVLDVYVRGETLLNTGLVGKAIHENLERILELLRSRKVSSIGVCGMGGVGKTTLAKHIHNRLLQQSKGHVFWITVSQEFTIASLQDKIARLVGLNLLDENEDRRAVRLHEALSRMKDLVLILDDVWEKIDMLKMGCPISMESCRLIITSRSLTVCRQFGCEKLIRVDKLCEDEAWELFNEKLGNEINLGPQVEEIAKSVANLCDGLPLGIVTVGGNLRGERSIYTWKIVLEELKERVIGQDGMEPDEVFEVLKYSFDRLNTNYVSHNHEFNTDQLCFLYCSLYREDYEICRDDLVREFISEGVLNERMSRKVQLRVGHSILDKLVDVYLLESCVDHHGMKCVRMHDLVRDMALKICEGKFMVNVGIPKEEEWTKDLEKVSLMRNHIGTIGDGTSPDCPHLSTLLLRDNPLMAIPDSFFSKMYGLSTLDLCRTLITMLPDSVSNLINLKALLLEDCYFLEKVPCLGKLKALRELNLSYTAITQVPQGVEDLFNLKFLSIDAHGLEMLPTGLLFGLVHLQYVKFPVHIHVASEEIENLQRLEQFWGRLESICDFNCLISTLRVRDVIYNLQVGQCDEESWEHYDREVSLLNCDLEDEEILGSDIEGISIRECEGLSACLLDAFSPLNHPKSLKRLRIQGCGGIECMLTSEQPFQFSNLEYIDLEELEDFKGMFQIIREIGASAVPTPPVFFNLKWLFISKCNKMTKLGLLVLGFPNLEEISISSCGDIKELFEDEESGFAALPKLKRLSLSWLPRLDSVCKATTICKAIEVIRIHQCPMLKKLPLHLDVSSPRSSLKEIEVDKEWWESLEWDNHNLPQLFLPFLNFY